MSFDSGRDGGDQPREDTLHGKTPQRLGGSGRVRCGAAYVRVLVVLVSAISGNFG